MTPLKSYFLQVLFHRLKPLTDERREKAGVLAEIRDDEPQKHGREFQWPESVSIERGVLVQTFPVSTALINVHLSLLQLLR